MIHLFYIHSPITLLTSLGTVVFSKLSKDDVVFIFGRAFVFEKYPYATHWLKDFWKLEMISNMGFILLPIRRFRFIKEFDKYLDRITYNKPFALYIPHDGNYLMRLMMSHKSCCAINFIEEGRLTFIQNFITNYKPIKYNNTLQRLLYTGLRKPNRKVLKNFNLYCISKQIKSIQNQYNTIVVPVCFSNETNANNYSDHFILIYDSYKYNTSNAIEQILKSIDIFVSKHINEKWLIKTHPHVQDGVHNRILSIFIKYNIDYEVLNNRKVILEEVIFKFSNLTLVGHYTSLLYYGGINGHTSYSLSGFLKKSEVKELKIQYDGAKFPLDYDKYVKNYE